MRLNRKIATVPLVAGADRTDTVDRILLALDQTPLELLLPQTRLAEARWRRSNTEAREAGCACGRPATEVKRHGGTIGRVPHETWTCAEHAGTAGSSRRIDGDGNVTWQEFHYEHAEACPQGQTRGWQSNIGSGQVTAYFCPHRTHLSHETGVR